jgi:thioredoxin reductase (NADPH)
MHSEDYIYDLIILGGGPAGLTAGLYAMRAALKDRAGGKIISRKAR